jgi:hypothetical protein
MSPFRDGEVRLWGLEGGVIVPTWRGLSASLGLQMLRRSSVVEVYSGSMWAYQEANDFLVPFEHSPAILTLCTLPVCNHTSIGEPVGGAAAGEQ